MDERVRQLRWLLLLRLVSLIAALALLPAWVTLAPEQVPGLALWSGLAVVVGSLPLWGAFFRRERVLGAVALAEVLLVGVLIYRYGQLQSPFALLYLPLLAQAATFLGPPGYILAAGYAIFGYGMAVWAALEFPPLGSLMPLYVPLWAPLWLAGGLALVTVIGLVGQMAKTEHGRRVRAARHLSRYRRLVEHLPTGDDETAFWGEFLHEVAAHEGFLEGALIRYNGPRPEVTAPERTESWQALAQRHQAVLRRRVLDEARPEILVENAGGRGIVCWPVPRAGSEEAAAVLCFLARRAPSEASAARRLSRWLPLASLALAAGEPHLTLHLARVDWRVLMNVTLHRLHDRLKRYLVLVHVDPGAVEGDALLLADAIAHAVEDALDRAPAGSQVRISVRRAQGGWRFQVETSAKPDRAEAPPRPGLLLARQVVSAHGGAWRAGPAGQGYRVSFTLPAPVDKQGS